MTWPSTRSSETRSSKVHPSLSTHGVFRDFRDPRNLTDPRDLREPKGA